MKISFSRTERAKSFLCIILCFLCASFNCSLRTAKSRPFNCIVIVIDALRKDHLGCFGYHRNTSPTMDRLSSEGIFITDVVSQSSHTLPSIASLFTGLYPYRYGIQFFSHNLSFHPTRISEKPVLLEKFTTLAEYFQRSDYTTLGIVSNPWLQETFHCSQGFEFYKYIEECDGKLINDAFFKFLQTRKAGKNFFAYLHYMDVHAPYYNKKTFKGLYTKYKADNIYAMGLVDGVSRDDLEYCKALYDENINYVDSLIKEVLDELRKKGILDNSIIAITSDHGDEFYDHEGFGHGTTLYQELINTFFIIHDPIQSEPQRVRTRARTIDFLPGILERLDIAYDGNSIDGRAHLFRFDSSGGPVSNRTLVYSELGDRKAVLSGDWKYIFNPFLKTEELYHLSSDPYETVNRVDDQGTVRRKFKNWISRRIRKELRPPEKSEGVPGGLEERLKALGYLGRERGKADERDIIYQTPLDKIDFAENSHNPLQLIYGWDAVEQGDVRSLCRIGPKARFVLKRESGDPKRLVINGCFTMTGRPDRVQKICLMCGGDRLGEHVLTQEGFFSIAFAVPDHLGNNRGLEFTLLCGNHSGYTGVTISSIRFE